MRIGIHNILFTMNVMRIGFSLSNRLETAIETSLLTIYLLVAASCTPNACTSTDEWKRFKLFSCVSFVIEECMNACYQSNLLFSSCSRFYTLIAIMQWAFNQVEMFHLNWGALNTHLYANNSPFLFRIQLFRLCAIFLDATAKRWHSICRLFFFFSSNFGNILMAHIPCCVPLLYWPKSACATGHFDGITVSQNTCVCARALLSICVKYNRILYRSNIERPSHHTF